jgi:spore coat protein H
MASAQDQALGRCSKQRALALTVVLTAGFGCSSTSDPSAMNHGDPTTTATSTYDAAHLTEVAIEMNADDWAALREEGPSVAEAYHDRSASYEYTDFQAQVIVNGRRYQDVTLRKKGFLGSLSRLRPSLKLELSDNCEPACPFKRLTLNNNLQDASKVRQCITYDLFDQAGLPAPRCNLAHVSVNGEALGTYSNVEPIHKPFLERYFGDTSGNLYEGQGTDFVAEDVERLQLKTNEKADDRSDARRLSTALEADDAELPSQLAEVLDIDRFRTFWAMEVLTGEQDGYSGNTNNYYAYSDPESGRFYFIPWGADGTFAETNVVDPLNTTRTVYARGRIANRLYGIPDERERFRARLRELAETLWNEDALEAELTRLSALAGDAWPNATADVTRHLRTHRSTLLAQLDQPAPEWIGAPAEKSPCAGLLTDIDVEFDAPYVDVADASSPSGDLSVTMNLDGSPVEGSWWGQAGFDSTALTPGAVVRAFSAVDADRGIFLQLGLPWAEFAPGSWPLHGLETAGLVVVTSNTQPGRFMGFIGDGSIELDLAKRETNAPIRGRLRGRLEQLNCAEL